MDHSEDGRRGKSATVGYEHNQFNPAELGVRSGLYNSWR
jgi:hypothetical protein